MKTFAYLTHPINTEQLKDLLALTKFMPFFLRQVFSNADSPFKVYEIKNLRSIKGAEIKGYLLVLKQFPEELQKQEDLLNEKIVAMQKIAAGLGADILGLGGNLSIFCDRACSGFKGLKIPITTGSAFTSWSAFEAIYRMAKIKNIDLGKSNLAVIGATGAIGSLCSRKLSSYVPGITLNSTAGTKLEQLKEAIVHLNPIEVIIEPDVTKAVKDADIIIFSDDRIESKFNLQALKPKAIVCDVSVGKNIAGLLPRPSEFTVIDSGLIKIPHKGIIPAPLAETMLLTFEEKFSSYSLGENINLDKMDEIADIAVRYGFEVWVPQAPIL